MKRTDRMTDLVGILLFAAVFLYLGAFVLRKTVRYTRTVQVTGAELLSAADAEGILLRSECLLRSGGGTPALTVREGERVAAGAPLGDGLFAPASGVFSGAADGYEALSPASLADLTPTRLRALMASAEPVPADAFGKLVTDYRWYFAAFMRAEDAASLSVGDRAVLDLGTGGLSGLPTEVLSVGMAEGEETAVVFRCEAGLDATLTLRCTDAAVRREALSCLRVPRDAIRADGDGGNYVWAVTAGVLERKDVTVLRTDGSDALVSVPAGPEALREGSTVAVRGYNLYEGKVLD